MSSINSPGIIQKILENGGRYPGDPRCTAVYQYHNKWGGTTYKLCYNDAQEKTFLQTGCFHEAVRLWGDGQLTTAGQMFLDQMKGAT